MYSNISMNVIFMGVIPITIGITILKNTIIYK
jgi:hypothetical protein